MKRVIFIGAGNLATNLSLEMRNRGFEILQIYSYTLQSAQQLGEQLGCCYTNELKEVRKDADLYIFSVKDAVLSSVLNQIPPNNGLWVHTAGSIPMSIFEDYTNRYGVFYPLQTFSKNRRPDFSDIPFFIEANTESDYDSLTAAASIMSRKVYSASSEQRKHLHLAAVFACNFTNHMYAIAARIVEEKGLPFDALKPLITETATKIQSMAPLDAQTGPAIRYDENVINKHLSLLEDESLRSIYKELSGSIYNFSNNKK